MEKHIFVMQDAISGNVGDPVFAENISTLKRSFAVGLASGEIPAWIARDCQVLHLGCFSMSESNVPYIDVLPVPQIVCRLSDSDIQEMAVSFRETVAKRFVADFAASQVDPNLNSDVEQLPTTEELEHSF